MNDTLIAHDCCGGIGVPTHAVLVSTKSPALSPLSAAAVSVTESAVLAFVIEMDPALVDPTATSPNDPPPVTMAFTPSPVSGISRVPTAPGPVIVRKAFWTPVTVGMKRALTVHVSSTLSTVAEQPSVTVSNCAPSSPVTDTVEIVRSPVPRLPRSTSISTCSPRLTCPNQRDPGLMRSGSVASSTPMSICAPPASSPSNGRESPSMSIVTPASAVPASISGESARRW